jgi:hypothetical protein
MPLMALRALTEFFSVPLAQVVVVLVPWFLARVWVGPGVPAACWPLLVCWFARSGFPLPLLVGSSVLGLPLFEEAEVWDLPQRLS